CLAGASAWRCRQPGPLARSARQASPACRPAHPMSLRDLVQRLGSSRVAAHLRHPTRRGVVLGLLALPALLLLYTLLLIPFTPAISDIRKAKTEQPAQVLSADGKLLAQYKWAHREWV